MSKKEEKKYEKRMVEAVELGHCGRKLRKAGEKFEFAGAPAHWFKEPGAKAAVAEVKGDQGAAASSEEAKAAKAAAAAEAKAAKAAKKVGKKSA